MAARLGAGEVPTETLCPSFADTGRGPLMRGKWEVVLYHADCEICHQIVPKVQEHAMGWTAFVELPPHGGRLVEENHNWLSLQIVGDNEYIAQTPVVLHVQDGVVRRVTQGKHAVLKSALNDE